MPTRRAPFAILAVLVLAAAGCVAPGGEVDPAADAASLASAARFSFDDLLVERLALDLPDGDTLDMAVFRPDVAKAGAADEKVPVLADIGPYYGNLAGPVDELSGFDERLAEYFVPRGYAVARVSLRGTGMSEGCFDVGGAKEIEDVGQIVEFLAAQPWSNGAVAVLGKSYDGTTPWMAALSGAPSLRTIVPISGISDMYRYTFYEGVAYPETRGFHTYYPLLVDYDTYPGLSPTAGLPHARQNLVRTCADIATQSAHGGATYATGDHGTAFWQERDYEPRMKDVKVPVFLVHGLQDWNVKPDNGIPVFSQLDVPKAMWLGQWEHDYPDINRHVEEWSRHDWNQTLLTWFDHWLKDVPNDWQQMANVQVQDSYGQWRTYETWPPQSAVPLRLHPQGDGSLHDAPGETVMRGLRDPASLGHRPGEDADSRGLTFLSGPMPRNVTIVGEPLADLRLSVDQPGGQMVVRLWNVTSDGEWKPFDHGARSVRHRESRDAGTPAPLNEVFHMEVRLYPQQTVLPEGNRLGMTLAPTGPAYLDSLFPLTTYNVHLGGDDASTLTLLAETPEDADALRGALQGAGPVESRGACRPTCGAHEIVI